MDAKAYVQWRLASAKGEKGVRQLRSELVARRDELADKLGIEVHARASVFGEAARMAPKLEDVLAGARAGLERASTAAGRSVREVTEIKDSFHRSPSGSSAPSSEAKAPEPTGEPDEGLEEAEAALEAGQQEKATELFLEAVSDKENRLRPERRREAMGALERLGKARQAHEAALARRERRLELARRSPVLPEHLPAIIVEQLTRECRGAVQTTRSVFSLLSHRLQEMHTWCLRFAPSAGPPYRHCSWPPLMHSKNGSCCSFALRETGRAATAITQAALEASPEDPMKRVKLLARSCAAVGDALDPLAKEEGLPLAKLLRGSLSSAAAREAESIHHDADNDALQTLRHRATPSALDQLRD